MAIPGMQEVQTLATKYSKPQLAHMAQSGLIEPTVAVMAGMLIDRIIQNSAKAPVTTVAEDVLNPPQQPTAMPMAPQGQEQFQPPQEQPQPEAPPQDASQGMPGLPSNLPTNMAGGGIISFVNRGLVEQTSGYNDALYDENGRLIPHREERIARYSPDLREIASGFGQHLANTFPHTAQVAQQAATDVKDVYNRNGVARGYGELVRGGLGTLVAFGHDSISNLVNPLIESAQQLYRGNDGSVKPTGIATLPAAAAKPPMPAAAAPQTAPRQRPASIAPPGMEPPATAAAPTSSAATPETPIVMPTYEKAYGQAKEQLERDLPKEDPYAEYKTELAGNKKKSDEDLKDSAWMRVAEFGLGMAAGSSPYAMVNAGKAGVDAIKGYGQDLKEKKTLDREDRKTLADIQRMEHAEKRDNVLKTADMAHKILSEVGADTRAQLQRTAQIQIAREGNVAHSADVAAANAAHLQGARIGARNQQLEVIQALAGNTKLAETYAGMRSAGTEGRDRGTLIKAWAADPMLQNKYKTFEEFESAINGTAPAAGSTFDALLKKFNLDPAATK